MIDAILDYLNNYFVEEMKFGKFKIENGTIETEAQTGQYIAIRGSVFNDGVYQYPVKEELQDEEFDGAIWLLKIPKDLIDIAKEIEEWQGNQSADSPALSPFQSESFGGYSYTKKSTSESVFAGGWQDVFAGRLSRWRKVRM